MHMNDWEQAGIQDAWVETVDSPSASVSATRAAQAGVRHVVNKVDGSFKTSTTDGVMRVFDGSTLVGVKYIHGAGALDYGFRGLPLTSGNVLTATLIGGGAGESGAVTMTGFSVAEGS